MKLLSNHLLVERVRRATVSTTGVIVPPPSLEDDFNTGGPKVFGVIAVGPGRRTRKGVTLPVECQPGDRVICHSYFTGAQEVEPGRFIITDDQIMVVIPGKP